MTRDEMIAALTDALDCRGNDCGECSRNLTEVRAALQAEAPPPAPSEAMPVIQMGDVVTTERGRRLVVDEIERRPATVAKSVWQGAEQLLINSASGGSVLDVAVVKIERPVTLWRRGSR